MEASSSSTQTQSGDPITRLQLSVQDLSGLYTKTVGDLLNAVEAKHQGIDDMVADFAGRVVSAHQDLNDQVVALQRVHRSEAAQLSRLRELEREHDAVTEELRSQTEAAGAAAHVCLRPRLSHTTCACLPRADAVRRKLARDLDALIDGILDANPPASDETMIAEFRRQRARMAPTADNHGV